MIALWIGRPPPERVGRLVLCFTSARFGPPRAWRERAATVRAEGTGAVADGRRRRWFTPAFAGREPGVFAAMRDDDRRHAAPRGTRASASAIETMDLRADLHAITAPTLVIAGRARPVDAAGARRRGRRGHRRRALRVLEGAAHLGNIEHADRRTHGPWIT